MKKFMFLILLFLGMSVVCYSQQMDTTIVGDIITITQTPQEIKPIIKEYSIKDLENQYRKAKLRRNIYQSQMNKLEWILKYGQEPVIVETPVIKESSTVSKVDMNSEMQAVLDYLSSIENPSLEKPDIQEFLQLYTPIQTSVVWRNDTIRMWMRLYDVDYRSSDTKAKLLEKVSSYLISSKDDFGNKTAYFRSLLK